MSGAKYPHGRRHNCTQGSPAWYDARRGKVTASRLSDVLAFSEAKTALCVLDPQSRAILEKLGNGKEAERKAAKLREKGSLVEVAEYAPAKSELSRENYMLQLLNERMTGATVEEFESFDMRRGMALEPEAFNAYEFVAGVELDLVGFTDHPRIKGSGASTDRMVRDQPKIAQAKCPKFTTHLRTVLGEPIAREYMVQMQWEMACEGAEEGDFLSYCPDVAHEFQVFVKRIPRDDAVIAMLEKAVEQFLLELEAKLETIKALAP